LGAISMRYYFFEIKKTQKHLEVMKDESQIKEEGKKNLLEPVKFIEELDYVERKEHEKRLKDLVKRRSKLLFGQTWFYSRQKH
jgi:glycerol-3-phosphate dehydrogenase